MPEHAPMETNGSSSITLGRALRVTESASFTFTETAHDPDTVLPSHAHERPAVNFVIQGHRTHRFGPKTFECPPGSMLFVPAAQVHSTRFAPHPARALMLEVRSGPALRWITDARFSVRLPAAGTFETIRRELRDPDDLSPLALEALAVELLVFESRVAPGEIRPPRWLLRARDALQAEIRNPPSVASLAAETGVHPAHLTREYRRFFGVSVGEAVRRVRVQAARDLVVDTDVGLAEIAVQCGYSDQSHLTRAFRAAYGITPAALRRQSGNARHVPKSPRRSKTGSTPRR